MINKNIDRSSNDKTTGILKLQINNNIMDLITENYMDSNNEGSDSWRKNSSNKMEINSENNTVSDTILSGTIISEIGTPDKDESNSWRKSLSNRDKPRFGRGCVRALEERYYKPRSTSKSQTGYLENQSQRYNKRVGRHKPVIKTTIQNLNLECVKPQRAGVIIYTVINGAIYFCLGLDSKTHDLTDFGGGVVYKTDGNVVSGALREFTEETLDIFETITIEDIKQCPVIYDENNLIIFIHMNIDPDTTCFVFHEKYKKIVAGSNTKRKYREPEVCGFTWLTWEEFQHSIKEKGIMFSRVQRFLSRADDFSYLL